MPTFQHGKNAFLAIGYETASTVPTLGATMTTTLTVGSISGFTGALIATDPNVVQGGSTYGYFINGIPCYSTTALAATGGTLIGTATGATAGSGLSAAATSQILPMVNLSPYINDVSFPQAIDTPETTTFSAAGVKTYIVGLKGWTISFGGMFDNSSFYNAGVGTVDNLMNSVITYQDRGNLVSFVYDPSTPGALNGGTAGIKYYGQAILTKYDLKSSVNGVVTFDGELQVTGAVTRSVLI